MHIIGRGAIKIFPRLGGGFHRNMPSLEKKIWFVFINTCNFGECGWGSE
jgi:hypothetical protein